MVRKKIFNLVKRSIVLILIIFYSCNSSSNLFLKNNVKCYEGIGDSDYENIEFIKNKEFQKVEEFIKKEYKAKSIRNIFYIKSKQLYYCEFYVYDYAIECLLLDSNMKTNFHNRVDFDW